MIRLFNKSQKTYKFTLTDNPVTHPQQSPMPTGKALDELDPEKDKKEIEKILKHEHYSTSKEIVIRPGLNEIENDEQGEYIYNLLGNPEEGGVTILGTGKTRPVTNSNFLIEVGEDGKEIKDNLFRKCRMPSGIVTFTEADPELFKLKQNESV